MKKKYIAGSVALLLIIGILVLGSSDDKEAPETSTTITKDAVETVQKESVQQDTVMDEEEAHTSKETSETADAGYIGVGDELRDDALGVVMNVEDIGIYTQDDWALLYVTLDVANNGSEDATILQSGTVYVDDYQVTTGYNELNGPAAAIMSGLMINDIELIPDSVAIKAGRKMKYIMYEIVSDSMNEGQKVEFEIFNQTVLFKKDGEWFYGNNQSSSGTGGPAKASEGGIGNPIIDSDPDRYIPEGVSGEIDAIDDGFYADSGNTALVPGEYYIIGGENAILTITEDAISMSGGKTNFDNAEIKPADNGSPQYWVYVEGNYYAVVSFFDGGLYFRTDEADSDEDWDEGFYLKF